MLEFSNFCGIFPHIVKKGFFMQSIPVAGFNRTMLVDFNRMSTNNYYRMDLIHLDPYRRSTAFSSPICRIEDKDIENIHIGDIGEYQPGGEYFSATWKKEFDYQDHNYELAIFVGLEPNQHIRVWGNKIGDKNVQMGITGIDFQRGDDLLIQIDSSLSRNQYRIIRNINQELLKYKYQQKMAKSL